MRIQYSLLIIGLCLAPAYHTFADITIGPGPYLGVDAAGNSYNEEFQDWVHADCRALDGAGATVGGRYNLYDDYDDCRDLIAFYSRVEGDDVFFRVDLYDLKVDAEHGFLDIYVAIDCAWGGETWMPDMTDVQVEYPWEVCIKLYDTDNYAVIDTTWTDVGGFRGAYYHSAIDSVEFGIDRQVLVNHGWDGGSPMYFTIMTTKDFTDIGGGSVSDATDAFFDDGRGYDDGVINGAAASDDGVGRAKYATIAHGNQSINQADDLRVHIYDPPTSNKTGFIRTLQTHEIFNVPLNIHMSGSLIAACKWAPAPMPGDLSDGPAFLQWVADFVDADQNDGRPGALIGGVFAEHIMPYFEGDVNAHSIELFTEIATRTFGVAGDPSYTQVMHTPERVIRSQSTGLSPLDGHTFEDIGVNGYFATYLDEVTHYHWWFDAAETRWSGAGGSYDAPEHHKIHLINGVYSFLINDREDQAKFGPHDGGMALDTRFTLVDKAAHPDQAQLTLVFDDWEALAGKSFDPQQGQSVENNNQWQYQQTIRWAANHPWIEIVNLRDVLDRAINPGNPEYDATWVVDQGTRYDLGVQTYEWLKHAAENSYHYWYYNSDAGYTGNEQSFYDLVPVLTGPQGDYHQRFPGNEPWDDASANAKDAADGAVFLPSGKAHGDLNTPGTLLHDAWADIVGAPDNGLRELAELAYVNLIYETAWHEEDYGQTAHYQNQTYGNPWPVPDPTWDGLNTWALRLQNHVRSVGILAAAAHWAADVHDGLVGPGTAAYAIDLDHDGQDEYVIENNRVFACFERWGGRLTHGFSVLPTCEGDYLAVQMLGAPMANPTAPGEEEHVGDGANRCSTFKDMSWDYVDAEYSATVVAGGLEFTSPDGLVHKRIELADGSATLSATYTNGTGADLYVRTGASPDVFNLALDGRTNLYVDQTPSYREVRLDPTDGTRQRRVRVYWGSAAHNPAPADAGFENRNLAMTEQIEVYGGPTFDFGVQFGYGMFDTDYDADVDVADIERMLLCLSGPETNPLTGCVGYCNQIRWDDDLDIDLADFAGAQRSFTSAP